MQKDRQVKVLKHMLGQIYRADKRRRQLDDRLETVRARRQSPIGGVGYAPAPKGSKRGDGASAIIFKLAEIEDKIRAQKREIDDAVVRVMDIIDCLPVNSIEREICELRHIDLKPWGAIAASIPMSRSQVNRRYNAAIDLLLTDRRIREMVAMHEEEYLHWEMERE